jgi:hypothetical protein
VFRHRGLAHDLIRRSGYLILTNAGFVGARSSAAEFGASRTLGTGKMKICLLMILVSTIVTMANLQDWRNWLKQARA